MAINSTSNMFFAFDSPNPFSLNDLLPELQTVPDSNNFSTHSIAAATPLKFSTIPDGQSMLLFSKTTTNDNYSNSLIHLKNQKELLHDKKKLSEKQTKYKWLWNKEKSIQSSFQNYTSIISQIEESLQKTEQSV